MPKISYLDKDKSLVDDTEVTQEHIENKIAEIEALLRGRIDEDNLLSYRNDFEPIGIPPSLVTDLPSETKFVNNCMKMFSSNIERRLFDPLVNKMNLGTTFRTLNSSGVDILLASTTDLSVVGDYFKVVSVEIPANYSPVFWNDLWDIVSKFNKNIKVSHPAEAQYVKFVELEDKDDFFNEMGINPKDYCEELWYDFSNVDDWECTKSVIDIKNNNFTCRVDIKSDEDEWYFRLTPVILCRVNP